MNSFQRLQKLGQSVWLDGINRELLHDDLLPDYIDECCVKGLTSNTAVSDRVVNHHISHDDWLSKISASGKSDEISLHEQTLDDLWEAADLLRPAFDKSNGIDGWVSMEISPLAAGDISSSIKAARQIQKQGGHPNLLINIPGTASGLPIIEESIFAGIPINVTLLFSREQYVAAAEAYQRGIERRLAAGLNPRVTSTASIVVNNWDLALRVQKSTDEHKRSHTMAALARYDTDRAGGVDPQIAAVTSMFLGGATAAPMGLPSALHNQLGIAMAQRNYHAYSHLLLSPRWQKLAAAGAQAQRLLWANTDTRGLDVHETHYIEALIAAGTIASMSEKTLHAFKELSAPLVPISINDSHCETMLARFRLAGINIDALALKLQRSAMQALLTSSNPLLRPSPSQTQDNKTDRYAFA